MLESINSEFICNQPHYRVDNEIFFSKMLASIKSHEIKKDMTWHFYDNCWKSFDIDSYKPPLLRDAYKNRAQNLRDSYDYLILYYSGGIDSWTILNTFLTNNIKLDHIVVKFPFTFLEKKLHNPNMIDTTDTNRLSEWDFVVKEDLKWISKNYPNIKIELVDYLENPQSIAITDNMFSELHGQYSLGSILRGPNNQYTDTERTLSNKGKLVGCIYGTDKPRVAYINKKMYYFFVDAAIGPAPPRYDPSVVTEYFYWSHNHQEVLHTQIKIIFNFFKTNPQFLHIISPVNWKSDTERWRRYVSIIKDLIYPDWDSTRFQCDKPSFGRMITRPGEVLLESHPEIAPLSNRLLNFKKSYIEKTNPNHLFANGEFMPVNSRLYQIGEII